MKVALTGGLSCGKSSVCRFLKDLGAYVVSADEVVHRLLENDGKIAKKVIDLLGEKVLTGNRFDKKKIAQEVFTHPRKLKELEGILHPVVKEEIEHLYTKQKALEGKTLFIAEIPLLFEAGFEKSYDAIVVVVASPELCLERFQKATGYGKDQYEKRMAKQMPIDEKCAKADYVITNTGSITELEEETKSLYNKLTYS